MTVVDLGVSIWEQITKRDEMKAARTKTDEMKVKYDKPENLKPYANNNKYHSDEQILRLASSISEFGFDVPIVVDKNNVIIKGAGRREAALKLKLKRVPVIIADYLTEAQVIASRIADNKTSSNDYNMDAIKFDLGILNRAEYNINLAGLEPLDLEMLMKENVIDDDFARSVIGKFENSGQAVPNPVIGEVVTTTTAPNVYTENISTPIYEPNGEKPLLSDLVDLTKYKSLCSEIEKINLGKEDKQFLLFAATRHIVFNYEKIANYYAHSAKPLQELFENSALVIVDFNKAVENGFVKLTKEINERFIDDSEEEDFDEAGQI